MRAPLSRPTDASAAASAGQRSQRLDPLERRLGPGPLEHAPHQEHRFAGDRHDEVGLLVRAREVGEIGVLDDERPVEPVGGER